MITFTNLTTNLALYNDNILSGVCKEKPSDFSSRFMIIEKDGIQMSKTTSAVKRKYNKGAYHRYEFSVKVDSKLYYMLERYKTNDETNLSELIRNLLGRHFDVDPEELYSPYYLRKINGEWTKVPNEL